MAQEGLKNLDQGLLELEALVKELENSNLSIDDAIEKYAQGMELAVACRRSLNDMSRKVAIVREKAMRDMNELNQAEAAQAQQLGAQPNAIPNAQVAGAMSGLPGDGNQGSWR